MSTGSTELLKRLFIGRALDSSRLGETLLPKKIALPVFCSDPISSVAYATEQIVLVLGLGGLALLHLTPWIAVGVVALLWRRPRGWQTILLLWGAAAAVLGIHAASQGVAPEFALPLYPLFIVTALAALAGDRGPARRSSA